MFSPMINTTVPVNLVGNLVSSEQLYPHTSNASMTFDLLVQLSSSLHECRTVALDLLYLVVLVLFVSYAFSERQQQQVLLYRAWSVLSTVLVVLEKDNLMRIGFVFTEFIVVLSTLSYFMHFNEDDHMRRVICVLISC